VDEASRVSDELYQAMRPMLAVSDGTMWLMSTPWGKRGFFYETWEHGGEDWERVRVTAAECGRIPATFLEQEKRVMSGRFFGQEYCCEFGEQEDGVFDVMTIEKAFCGEFQPLDTRRWR
jgi:hypothetical protein